MSGTFATEDIDIFAEASEIYSVISEQTEVVSQVYPGEKTFPGTLEFNVHPSSKLFIRPQIEFRFTFTVVKDDLTALPALQDNVAFRTHPPSTFFEYLGVKLNNTRK